MNYVYEVYKEKSFSKAAKNLFISQPSLSSAIKKVETELGFDIFDRSTKPIGLTEFGEEYIRSVKKMLDIESNFSNYINDLSDMKAGNISIGGTNFFTSYILPPIISEFSVKFPNIKINIVETNTTNLERQLYTGELDIVIDNYDFDEDTYDRQFFSKDNIILAVPASFESNNYLKDYKLKYSDICNGTYLSDEIKNVSLSSFKEEPFLLLKDGNDTRIRAQKICNTEKFEPKVLLELDQQITSYNLTSYGMGISFISDLLVKNVSYNNKICFYKLETQDSERVASFYYKKFRYLKRSAKEFLNIADKKSNYK